MMTKYGTISDEQFDRYKRSVVGRIYAILPMKEENVSTVREYVEGLNRELVGSLEVFTRCERILSVVCLLESIVNEADHAVYRKDVLRCCNIISEEVD